MTYRVEITDTFGGHANYSWVKFHYIPTPKQEYNSKGYKLSIVRNAKKEAGWTKIRTVTEDYGDSYAIRPVGRRAPCWIMFVDSVHD